MKQFFYLISLLCLSAFGLFAQGGQIFHTGSEGPVYDYSVVAGEPRPYYDSGGPEKNMRDNLALTIVQLKPVNRDAHITILFEEMEIGDYDQMRFYPGAVTLWNGPDEEGYYYYDWPKDVSPILALRGNPARRQFAVSSTAADGCMTVAFQHNSTAPGWKAMIYCVPNGAPEPGAQPVVRYVSQGGTGDGSSWAGASGDLQAMIDASSAGDEIWIARGTYKPARLIKATKKRSHAFILKDGVSLYGGFAGSETRRDERQAADRIGNRFNVCETILSADDDTPDVWTRQNGAGSEVREEWHVTGHEGNSNHILYSAETFSNKTTIEGLTLRGATADVHNVYAGGGALYASGCIELRYCDISEQYAYTNVESLSDWKYHGGGVTILNGGGKALVQGCAFERCMVSMPNGIASGAGVYIEHGAVRESLFDGCIALDRGGAVHAVQSEVTGCTIRDSYSSSGGGIYATGATLRGNTVSGCTSMRGGAVWADASVVQNNLLYNCFANDPVYTDPALTNRGGGAVWAEGASDLIGNLIYNCSGFKGGGVVMTGTGAFAHNTVAHCASADAAADASPVLLPEAVTPLNSIYGDDLAAAEHFVAPSDFAGFTRDASRRLALQQTDWHLKASSPLCGTGTSSEYDAAVDLYGDPRAIDGRINPGAIARAVVQEQRPAIVMTLAQTDSLISIGTGGRSTFYVDWGDGNLAEYQGAKALNDIQPLGTTIKIYGEDIMILLANGIGLTALDVTNAPMLSKLQCNNNDLTALDLSNNTGLTGLYCSGNKIATPLDLSRHTSLRAFDISNNEIPGHLDMSQMTQLSSVVCFGNKLTRLSLPKEAPLNTIDCDNNLLATIDLTGITALAELNCGGNLLTRLDLTQLPNLTKVYAPENRLTHITFDANPSIEQLTLFDNEFSSIDLTGLSKLTSLYLQDNQLSALDLSAAPQIQWLNVSNNQLTALDVTPLAKLLNLRCGGNKIPSVDLSANSLLNTIWIDDNLLTELDVKAQKNLFWLTCSGNRLETIDLSANPSIVWLECARNQFRSLDLSAQKSVQKLYCDHNQITELKLTNYAGLQGLRLNNNRLSAEALTALLNSLPDVSGVEIHDNNREWAKIADISENPGTEQADQSKAAANGWVIRAETALSAPEAGVTPLCRIEGQWLVASVPLASVVLYDLQGRPVWRAAHTAARYALPALPAGAYLFAGKTAQGVATAGKLIIH